MSGSVEHAIPKGKGDIRPITIEPILPQILETILDNRIYFVNEALKKTDRFNGGFIKNSNMTHRDPSDTFLCAC